MELVDYQNQLTLNLSTANQFNFVIHALPGLSFLCSNVSLPSISIQPVTNYNPMGKKNYPIHGDLLDFTPLIITFMVDENLDNYIAIMNWMRGMASPDGSEEFVNQIAKTNLFPQDGLYSDAKLIVFKRNSNKSRVFTFKHVFPSNLSDILFNQQAENVEISICTVTFEYSDFIVE